MTVNKILNSNEQKQNNVILLKYWLHCPQINDPLTEDNNNSQNAN